MSRAINSGKISSRVFLGVDSTDPKSETKVPQAKYFYLQGGRRINLEPFKYIWCSNRHPLFISSISVKRCHTVKGRYGGVLARGIGPQGLLER